MTVQRVIDLYRAKGYDVESIAETGDVVHVIDYASGKLLKEYIGCNDFSITVENDEQVINVLRHVVAFGYDDAHDVITMYKLNSDLKELASDAN